MDNLDMISILSQAPTTGLALLVWYEVKHIRQSIQDLAVAMAKLETKHGEKTQT